MREKHIISSYRIKPECIDSHINFLETVGLFLVTFTSFYVTILIVLNVGIISDYYCRIADILAKFEVVDQSRGVIIYKKNMLNPLLDQTHPGGYKVEPTASSYGSTGAYGAGTHNPYSALTGLPDTRGWSDYTRSVADHQFTSAAHAGQQSHDALQHFQSYGSLGHTGMLGSSGLGPQLDAMATHGHFAGAGAFGTPTLGR